MWNIIWLILIGFVAGLIARMLLPGRHNPSGFILTSALGIAGSALATWIGQTLNWYRVGEDATGAGLIAATVGAVVVLFIWHRLVASGAVRDPGESSAPGQRRRG